MAPFDSLCARCISATFLVGQTRLLAQLSHEQDATAPQKVVTTTAYALKRQQVALLAPCKALILPLSVVFAFRNELTGNRVNTTNKFKFFADALLISMS